MSNFVVRLFLFLVCITGFRAIPTPGAEEETPNNAMVLPEIVGDSFYYFGFGSNLLAKRIHIQNKSAVRKGMGKVHNYRLDFHTVSRRWMGAVATIVPTNGSHVYGAIWQIDLSQIGELDRQEAVHTGMYVPISVPVETPEGVVITCRAYQLSAQPTQLLKDEAVPEDRQPSKSYLKVIVQGAIETGLPQEYVDWLKTIKHNGNVVDDFEKKLGLESVELFN